MPSLPFECVTISDQGYSLRVIHVHVGEGIAHVLAPGEVSGSVPRVSSDFCLTCCSGFEQMSQTVVDCQTSVPWSHCGGTSSHTNQTPCFIFTVVSQLRLELNTLPLVCARGMGRRCTLSWLGLCDGWLMLMYKRCSRNAMRMRVLLTASLSSLTACRTRRR